MQRGEILGLLGENGAGKTTLMNILFGHYVADAGTIEVEGKVLPPGEPKAALAAGIGMVHQHFTLAENLTVLDNIMLGTESLWQPVVQFARRPAPASEQLAEDFGLAVDPDAMVSSLSVGERQRVEILKALYRDARILILDEPTAVLTPQESAALFDTLKRFVAKGLSIIFISHKLGEILAACSRVASCAAANWWPNARLQASRELNLPSSWSAAPFPRPRPKRKTAGAAVLSLAGISARRRSQSLAATSRLSSAAEKSSALPASPAMAKACLPMWSAALRPSLGRHCAEGRNRFAHHPRAMVAAGWRAFRKTAMPKA